MILYIGNHTSSSKGYAAMGRQMLKTVETRSLFYPQSQRRQGKRDRSRRCGKISGAFQGNHFGKLVAHAPYTMNACAAKENLRDLQERSWQMI